MGRILAIDYGLKRVGLAVTDPLKIIATPLETVPNAVCFDFLKSYCKKEDVELFVIGMPKDLLGNETDATPLVKIFVHELINTFPDIPVKEVDERFTSKLALDAMIRSGSRKKHRREKSNIDKLSATIILQSYMEQNR